MSNTMCIMHLKHVKKWIQEKKVEEFPSWSPLHRMKGCAFVTILDEDKHTYSCWGDWDDKILSEYPNVDGASHIYKSTRDQMHSFFGLLQISAP